MSGAWLMADLKRPDQPMEAEMVTVQYVSPNWIRLVIGEWAVLTVSAQELDEALEQAKAEAVEQGRAKREAA